MGAASAASPSELMETCDVGISMVSDPEAALAVAASAAPGISAGKGFVDMSTVDAETAASVAKLVEEKGGRYLEVRGRSLFSFLPHLFL